MNKPKEYPIVLSVDEITALRNRCKIQHRMPLEPQPYINSDGNWEWNGNGVDICVRFKLSDRPFFEAMQRRAVGSKAAPFKVGDKLWAQEEHRPIGWLMEDGEIMIEYRDGYSTSYNYLTEEELENNPNDDYPIAVIQELIDRGVPVLEDSDRFDLSDPKNLPHWRSAEDMPRFATRSMSEITIVRIDRIQNINEAEALASGLIVHAGERGWDTILTPNKDATRDVFDRDAWREAFATYWDATHGKGAWERNDWVWVWELKKADTYE